MAADHVDLDSLAQLVPHQPLLLVPEGDAPLMRKLGFQHVIENSFWSVNTVTFSEPATASLRCSIQRHSLVPPADGAVENLSWNSMPTTFGATNHSPGSWNQVSFIAVPANHWSCRSPFDANQALFLGWVIVSHVREGAIYFAGDTAPLLDKDFADICRNQAYPPVSVCLQPGGPNHERDTMQKTHASAIDAVVSHMSLVVHSLLPPEQQQQHHPDAVDAAAASSAPSERALPGKDELWRALRNKLTLLMHHNTFELGVDRFNEAAILLESLFAALELRVATVASSSTSSTEPPSSTPTTTLVDAIVPVLDTTRVFDTRQYRALARDLPPLAGDFIQAGVRRMEHLLRPWGILDSPTDVAQLIQLTREQLLISKIGATIELSHYLPLRSDLELVTLERVD